MWGHHDFFGTPQNCLIKIKNTQVKENKNPKQKYDN